MVNKPPFDVEGCLSVARERLTKPAPFRRIKRPLLQGEVVARFVLPLELCQPQNRTRHGKDWQLGKTKQQAAALMALQARRWAPRGGVRWPRPLPGIPQVLACRFSPTEPDRYADFAKAAIDVLTMPTPKQSKRLGLLLDDRPSCATVYQWWEPSRKTEGFVYLEVRTGEAFHPDSLTDWARVEIVKGLTAGIPRQQVGLSVNVPKRVVDMVARGEL